MKIPPIALKSVGFIAEICGSDFANDTSQLVGTAFLVSVPAKTIKGYRHCYFVTAKHVLQEKPNTKIAVVVNAKSGGVKPIEMFQWYKHPDEMVDVAIGLFAYDDSTDITAFGVEDAFNDCEREPIGVGDEVFFPGLFVDVPGLKQIVPIVRHGTVAMLPFEKIEVKGDFADVYLVEARSILGISGSPVFVRETIGIRAKTDDGRDVIVHGVGPVKLLGLMQGHWDVNESEINQFQIHENPRGVNIGLAIVVPAAKILEVINLPDLKAMRDEIERERIKYFGSGV